MSEFCTILNGSPLADGVQWSINEDFVYISDLGGTILVPAGFCTDFASIPKAIQNIYPVWYRYGPAAIIHDFLYFGNCAEKEKADLILHEAMVLLGVDEVTVAAIYNGVKLFGKLAWDRNAALKASGYKRMVVVGSGTPPYAGIPS